MSKYSTRTPVAATEDRPDCMIELAVRLNAEAIEACAGSAVARGNVPVSRAVNTMLRAPAATNALIPINVCLRRATLYAAELRAQCLAVQRPNESNPLGVCCDIVKPVFSDWTQL